MSFFKIWLLRAQCKWSYNNKKDLSADQQYLYDFCNAVSNGKCPGDLESKTLGKLSNGSGWNNLAILYIQVICLYKFKILYLYVFCIYYYLYNSNKMLQFYISTEKPSAILFFGFMLLCD